MKIQITGATGFVGKNLQAFLESKNYQTQSLPLRNESWVEDFDKQSDALIHLAGKAHDTSNTSAPEDYFKVNLELTKKVFEKFLDSKIDFFFFFSSVKAVADTVDTVLEENIVGTPLTPYGKSKLKAEEYLLKQKLPSGKRIFIIRPCMIHGSGNKGNLNLLFKIVNRGIPWPLVAYQNKRSFLSIDNLNFLIDRMLQQELESGVYNFSDDEPLSTNQLIKIIAQSTGKKPKYWKLNPKYIEKIASIGDHLKLPLNTERLKKLTENYVVSNTKIKKALMISSLPISAREGMIKTIKNFQQKTKQ